MSEQHVHEWKEFDNYGHVYFQCVKCGILKLECVPQKTFTELIEEKKMHKNTHSMGRHFGMEADEFCLEK